MPKYGLFRPGINEPIQECEGDYMKRDGEFVTVFRKNPNPSLGNARDVEVGQFTLEKGQMVREIK
ncbi:MAG TPA: hypothetical protein VJY15_01360 [Candidatus Acidoferrum sp.]|nr:hypothetical protein [Candidatus Acidoferrum sp.]